jgi:hypothetical protein
MSIASVFVHMGTLIVVSVLLLAFLAGFYPFSYYLAGVPFSILIIYLLFYCEKLHRRLVKPIRIRSHITLRSLAQAGCYVSVLILTFSLDGKLLNESLALYIMIFGIGCGAYVAWNERNRMRQFQE